MKIKKIAQSAGLVATVVDNLESKSTTDALSANQGRILNEQCKRKIITAYINRKSFTQSEYWGAINLAPFDSYISTTDKITVTDKGLEIGKGISKVLVSAQCKGIDHSSFGGDKTFSIMQNNVIPVQSAQSYITNLNNWCAHSISPLLLDCKEGDIFSIEFGGGAPGTGELLGESLTIEIIE